MKEIEMIKGLLAAVNVKREREDCLENFDEFEWRPKSDQDKKEFESVRRAIQDEGKENLLECFLSMCDHKGDVHCYFYVVTASTYIAQQLKDTQE